MKVRLIDVANKAGVSKSTASQYLNGRYEYMSVKTKERIRLAIEELDFIPNPIARSLKTQKTNTIGIMVQNITGAITSQVIRGVDDYCKRHKYNLLIYNTDYDEAVEKKSISILKSLSADGLIITSSGKISDLLNKEDELGLPVVHIHRDFNDLHVNTAYSNFYEGTYTGTNYLLNLNHKRIGIITRPYENIPTRIDRIRGWESALKDANLVPDSELIQIARNEEDVAKSYEKLINLEHPPTAVFTLYSTITISMLNYFGTHDISIPRDISLIAFDDLPLAHLLKNPPTVVTQSAMELGEKSCQLLLEKIENPDGDHNNIVLPCHMIVRNSCKKL